MISVFTATHDCRWLSATHDSLRAQTYADYEWVVVPNGDARLPEGVRDDPRVRVVPAPAGARPGIGFLKGLACRAAAGDLLVELDHDDLLVPQALERLAAHRADSDAGFFYSDFANFLPSGTSWTYDGRGGWERYPVRVAGVDYEAMSAFDPEPSSLHHISWAPNHVRAWTREAYDRAGGHDPALAIADDHDLVCRTYLAGVAFRHVPECLYLYRERPASPGEPANSYRQSEAELSRLKQEVSNKYVYLLVEEWCRRQGLRTLDLSPPRDLKPGYEPLPLCEWPDDPRGLRCPGPGTHVEPGSVGCVRAHDALGYLDRRTIVPFWNWLYDSLAPGGWLCARTPAATGPGGLRNPRHRSLWTGQSAWYVTRAEHQAACPGLRARFLEARGWEGRDGDQNPVACFDLVALKGQRCAGAPRI